MSETYPLDLNGYKIDLPIMTISPGVKICFFNLHGNPKLTEHCGKELAKKLSDCDIILTAES